MMTSMQSLRWITNVPYHGGNFQSYNKVYETTDNPWDLSRTPGGSSGGSAAAIAAGFTPLELGDDLAGSVAFAGKCSTDWTERIGPSGRCSDYRCQIRGSDNHRLRPGFV